MQISQDAATDLHILGTILPHGIFKMDPQWKVVQLAGLISKIDQNVQNSKGCQFWSTVFSVNQRERGLTRGPKYGRLKVKWPNGRTKFYLAHRFMFMLQNDLTEIAADLHVSHLCHNSLCINPEHLSLEPPNINNSRQVCKHLVPQTCQTHGMYPECII